VYSLIQIGFGAARQPGVHATTTARCSHPEVDPLRRVSEHIGNCLAAALGETESATGAEIVPLTLGALAKAERLHTLSLSQPVPIVAI
jgi:hypothetical protein